MAHIILCFFCNSILWRMACYYSKKDFFFFNRLQFLEVLYITFLYFWETMLSDTGRCFMKLVFPNRVMFENLGLNEVSKAFTVRYFLVFDMPICFVNFQCRLFCTAFVTLFNTKSYLCMWYSMESA